MTRVVIDASALAAIVFGEPEGKALAARLEGATVYAPTLLPFELASVAWKKARRDPKQASAFIAALDAALSDTREINWRTVNPVEVALLALAIDCSAYDAAYVWLAGSLGADLVTLDARVVRASMTTA